MSLKKHLREEVFNNSSKTRYSTETAGNVLRALQKLAPGIVNRDLVENMASEGKIEYTQAEEMLNICESQEALKEMKSSEAVIRENFLGDDLAENKYDADFISKLAIQKVAFDSLLTTVRDKEPMFADTIYDVINELSELTKKAQDKYGNEIDLVYTDISTMLHNQDEVDFINKIKGTQVRNYLNDEKTSDTSFKATNNLSK